MDFQWHFPTASHVCEFLRVIACPHRGSQKTDAAKRVTAAEFWCPAEATFAGGASGMGPLLGASKWGFSKWVFLQKCRNMP